LPMILTDVGGARELIEDDDVGILIAPPISLDELSPARAHVLGSSDDAGHVHELHGAMRRMVVERPVWTMKGLNGMVKFPRFDIDTVATSYEALLAPLLTGTVPDVGPGN